MASIVETDIRNIQACVILGAQGEQPQLLATYDTVDADGNTVRHRQSPDWYPTASAADQAAIQGLIASFVGRARNESEIPA